MPLLAFSVQHEVEKYGAYVAIACFFGLAILSLLYFAQARELRRLREWAGVQPERPEELEARVNALADSVRRVQSQGAAAPRQVVPQPAPAVSNGAHKLKPEQVAALAFARAAGVPKPPHPPQAAPVPEPAAVAAQAEPATALVPPAPAPAGEEPAPTPAPAGAGNGNGHGSPGDVPAPVTPAGRRPQPAAPLRRPAPSAAPARRMPTGPPARRETSRRSLVATIGIGVIVVAAVVFAATKVLGGGSPDTGKPAAQSNKVVPPGSATNAGTTGSAKKAKAAAPPARPTVTVEVLNGTTTAQLAATMRDKLVDASYTKTNLGADNDPQNRQRATSAVLYKPGALAAAQDVARVLDIATVKKIDATTASYSEANGKSVVVEVGADKAGT